MSEADRKEATESGWSRKSPPPAFSCTGLLLLSERGVADRFTFEFEYSAARRTMAPAGVPCSAYRVTSEEEALFSEEALLLAPLVFCCCCCFLGFRSLVFCD